MKSKRFRVAFSFAGEKRSFVAKVARLLAKQFGEAKILYDKYHEAELARRDLGIYLPELFYNESDLVVVVVCPHYDEKKWTGLEWTAIHGLLSHRKHQEVMFGRFEHAKLTGLYPTAGFVDLDHKTPQQTATLILERLALNEGKPKDHYSRNPGNAKSRRSTKIPNNLPRLDHFFGREAELKKIDHALAPQARGWGVLIDGLGGMGKTSLAIRAAELVPNKRFHRIIFLSSKPYDLEPTGRRSLGSFIVPNYLQMLNAIARDLGPVDPELAKSPENERSEVVLRALRGKNVLLVLDNLETLLDADRDQLFAFLNRLPRGCSAIVTSRRRYDAAARVSLGKLGWSAARSLITKLADKNDHLSQSSEAEKRSLYDETGGNPLLTRWLAGQLALGRRTNIPDAIRFLREAPPRSDPLEFIFGDLLATFNVQETNVLAALTQFSTPIEIRLIAELAGLSTAATEAALGGLDDCALVRPDWKQHQCAVIPLVGDFMRRQRPEIVQEIGARLAERAASIIGDNGWQKDGLFQKLDRAWPTLAPALPIFLSGPSWKLQWICAALSRFLSTSGRWDEWLSLCEQAEKRAVEDEDYKEAGWRAYQAGYVHYSREQEQELQNCWRRVVEYWSRPGTADREKAAAFRMEGLLHRLRKNYPAAIKCFLRALEMDRSVAPENRDVQKDLSNLSKVYFAMGEVAKSESYGQEAHIIAIAIGEAEGAVTRESDLATQARQRNDWTAAEGHSREALRRSKKLGRKDLIAYNSRYLAEALNRQGKYEEALPHAKLAVETYTRLSSPKLEGARATLRECEEGLKN